jgi:hypothetical protein
MSSNLKQEALDKVITDITGGLTSEEKEEITLANEPDGQDTHSVEEFEKATQKKPR